MINENALRDTLLACVQALKNQHEMISSILNELVAVRETVRGLDPTFADVLAQKQIEAARKQAPALRQIIGNYEEIIRKLGDGYVC
jgi:hypothetical protein